MTQIVPYLSSPRFPVSNPTASSMVEVIRHTYDAFEVVAYDLFGRMIRRRMFTYGRKRRQWAIEQAERWADEFYLQFDGAIHS